MLKYFCDALFFLPHMVDQIILENQNGSFNIILLLMPHFAITLLCQELAQKLHRLLNLFSSFLFFFFFWVFNIWINKKR